MDVVAIVVAVIVGVTCSAVVNDSMTYNMSLALLFLLFLWWVGFCCGC